MTETAPWHQPGRWLANPTYWDPQATAHRVAATRPARFIDCTLSEGDDCVGHQMSWNARLELMRRLAEAGVDEITLPSHATFEEERDIARAYRRRGLSTPLVAKGPGIEVPLREGWRQRLRHHVELGAETISPIYKWPFRETVNDFSGGLKRSTAVEMIGESATFAASLGVRVVPWISDSMRTRLETVVAFCRALSDAGVDGIYVVDSRGNSNPLATRVFIAAVRAAIRPDCDIYVQHHNDLGLATANALAAVEAGATVTDASVLGIGDRGGCVALEEAAVVFEMYGYPTNIKLDRLYELGRFTQEAFGVDLPPWKPIVGANWNKEEGAGHLEGATQDIATIAIAPSAVGRRFEAVIGSKILFGRERSSARDSDPVFLRQLLATWGIATTEPQFQRILHRARQAVATSYRHHYLTLDEFRDISEGVVLGAAADA